MKSPERMIRKRLPNTHAYMQKAGWVVDGLTRNGHIWLRHEQSGLRTVCPSSPGSYTSDRNTIRSMKQVEREALS